MSAGSPSNGGEYYLYVIGTFPLLTTTFIDREVEALVEDGVDVRVVSIRRSTGRLSPEQVEISRRVRYMLPVSFGQLLSSLILAIASHPVALVHLLVQLSLGAHPSLRARIRTVGHIVLGIYVWGVLQGDPPGHVHAHFADRAATVAMVLAVLFGIDYSLTAHANDIYVEPVLLAEKATRARFVATCTEFNAGHLRELAPRADVEVVYHGLDTHRYPVSSVGDDGPGRLVAVAQLKEKKGLTYLISACRILADEGVPFECEVVGEGALRDLLQQQIDAEGLTDQVHLRGSLPHGEVIERLRSSTVFVLPSVIAADGDRDGIPNVILEAMAMRRPVVSTKLSGIPEAVVDGETGTLVSPADPVGLAGAIAELLARPEVGSSMGDAGRKRVEEVFDVRKNAQRLEQLLIG